jgi:hypothetical protein
MNPALTISGVMITALARPKFCCSQVISGSRRKLDSVVSDAAMCAIGSACAYTFGATNAAAAATSATAPVERSDLDSMNFPLSENATLEHTADGGFGLFGNARMGEVAWSLTAR